MKLAFFKNCFIRDRDISNRVNNGPGLHNRAVYVRLEGGGYVASEEKEDEMRLPRYNTLRAHTHTLLVLHARHTRLETGRLGWEVRG